MDGEDGSGAGSYELFHTGGIDGAVVREDVGEHRSKSTPGHRSDGGRKSIRRGNDLAVRDIQSLKSQQKRQRAIGHDTYIWHTEKGRELLLKPPQERAVVGEFTRLPYFTERVYKLVEVGHEG